jgi:glycerol-3-phosphate cytidylyltransferase
VKGGDYSRDIIERPVVESHGGQIRIVSFKDGRSTTGIVQRIRQVYG